MARPPELPSRRAIALAIPCLPVLARTGAFPGLARRQDPAQAAACSTAILLRHAEKDPGGDPKDPGLSTAGQDRARALQRLLARAGATHLFASEFRRTRETLAPLAEARSLEVQVVPAADAAKLAERIRALPAGSVAVVAGHSNTIPALASALGARLSDLVGTPTAPMLRDEEYARLFVLTLLAPPAPGPEEGSEGGEPAAHAVELAYGA